MSTLKNYSRWIMKKTWFAVLILLIASRCAGAAGDDPNSPGDPNVLSDSNSLNEPNAPNDPNAPTDPIDLLSVKWDAIISILRDKSIEQKVKEEKINKIVTPYFDFPLMSKLALGRKNWPKLSPAQRDRFTCLFAERLMAAYRKKVALYKDERVVIKPKVEKKNLVYIPTELVSSDGKMDILYKLRKVDKGWKIYDLEIEGVSILLTYRSQFDDVLKNGTVEDLLSRLEKSPDG